MCKFNNRLFVFALYCLLGLVCISAKPVQETTRDFADDLETIVALAALVNSQDEHYDQRQKGEENYRVSLDGFYIGVPQEEATALMVITQDIFKSLVYLNNEQSKRDLPLLSTSDVNSDATEISPDISEMKQNHSANADLAADNNNASPMIVQIPAAKSYLTARHSAGSMSRTKSLISHFLNIIKRTGKH